MPDWNDLIQKSLEGIQLSREEQDEIVSEFRGYMEDRYEELMQSGVSESAALAKCREELKGLRGARRRIERAKGETLMNRRTRTLWLPGFVSIAAASIVMMVLEFVFFFRDWVRITDQVSYAYFVWVALLPFCGAAGAFVSRRGEGSMGAKITAGLFPSLAMLCVIGLGLVFNLTVNRDVYVLSHPKVFLDVMWTWVFAPALALLAGVAPFCVMRKIEPVGGHLSCEG